jgi:hypothetical protein
MFDAAVSFFSFHLEGGESDLFDLSSCFLNSDSIFEKTLVVLTQLKSNEPLDHECYELKLEFFQKTPAPLTQEILEC